MSEKRRVEDQHHAEFIELIRSVIARTGLSPTEIARTAGLSPSTITRQYPNATAEHGVSYRTIAKIKRAFPEPEFTAIAPSRNDRVSESAPAFETGPMNADLPLYHLIPIGAGVETTDAELVRFELLTGSLEQPAGRASLPWIAEEGRYFAIFMPGDSMLPRFRPGEKLLLDRLRPASAGDDVLALVHTDDGRDLYCIAQMMERDRNLVTLRQHGYQLTAAIHRSKISMMYLIIGVFEDG